MPRFIIDLVDDIEITPSELERWASATGPARLLLMRPLWPELARAPRPALGDVEHSVTSLRWLLRRVLEDRIQLDDHGGLALGVVLDGLKTLGFSSPPFIDHERKFTEVDVAHFLLRDAGMLRAVGRNLAITGRGRKAIGEPLELWSAVAATLISRGGFLPDITGLSFAASLQLDRLDEATVSFRLIEAIIESGGGRDGLDEGAGDIYLDLLCESVVVINTLCRSLHLFERNVAGSLPTLNAMGRATARAALRAVVVAGPRKPLAATGGRWN